MGNKFYISVECKYQVTNAEWLDLLMNINLFLASYRNGMYSNVEALLKEQEEAKA